MNRRELLLGLLVTASLPAIKAYGLGQGVDLRPGALNFAEGQAFRFVTTETETTLHFRGMAGPMRFAAIEDALNALIPGEEVRISYDQERGLWSTIKEAGPNDDGLGMADMDATIDVEGADLPQFPV